MNSRLSAISAVIDGTERKPSDRRGSQPCRPSMRGTPRWHAENAAEQRSLSREFRDLAGADSLLTSRECLSSAMFVTCENGFRAALSGGFTVVASNE
ncbi:hypothetical protein ACIRQQ_43625 [Streptomyces fuscichromogenes]|uniref:hypothetical protein n=1 Tax=Streptomyces fuscichromogenes TaxID=1324013 RepID=UPI003830CCAB